MKKYMIERCNAFGATETIGPVDVKDSKEFPDFLEVKHGKEKRLINRSLVYSITEIEEKAKSESKTRGD